MKHITLFENFDVDKLYQFEDGDYLYKMDSVSMESLDDYEGLCEDYDG